LTGGAHAAIAENRGHDDDCRTHPDDQICDAPV
jgi:hypothetical protein